MTTTLLGARTGAHRKSGKKFTPMLNVHKKDKSEKYISRKQNYEDWTYMAVDETLESEC